MQGASGRVQVVVAAKSGDASYFTVFADGALAESGVGVLADPDLTLTLTPDDAARVFEGSLGLAEAFMQGRAKAVGDIGTLMALMPVIKSGAQREALAALAAG